MINVASINLDLMVIITTIALFISICAFLNPILNGISNYRKSRNKVDAPVQTFDAILLRFTICLTIVMLCNQFVSEFYGAVFLNSDIKAEGTFPGRIFVFEIFASSFAGTLKSFGADDNFLSGIENIKLMLQNVFEANDMVIQGYSIIASIVAICAPITGATIFFEILANFFPKVKLWVSRYCVFKKKYYFSELNERSLALAKSISQSAKFIRPDIIFTDAYADKTQENISEFLADAKRIGAICLRDDITHLQKRGCGQRKFFLIDDNEVKNLQALTNLTDKFNHKSLKKSEVYLFCQDLIYTDIEKQVRKKLEKEYGYGDKDFTIIPVRCYRNLITNMIEKIPLYEPIVHKMSENPDKKTKLNVTIFGVGDIGREMFLTTYWIGQMLNCELNINVISKESEEEFWGKIDYINPEIRYTTYEKHEVLRVYKDKDEFSDTYCKVKYFSCDIQSDECRKLLEREDGRNTIFDTHYFLVSLGSDQLNLSVANTLKKHIMKYHIEHKDRDDKTIINYVVYNADLSSTLNNNPFVCSYSKKPDIYMQAVGGVEQNYTATNIFMTDYYEDATGAAKSYDNRQGKKQRKKAYKNRLKSEYEYWSNLALRLHFKYKVFSVYPFEKSIFDDELEYKDNRVSTYKKYVEEFRGKTDDSKAHIKKKDKKQDEKNIVNREPTCDENRLQWLEHRRWNAFLRTMGYRHTKDYNVYLEYTHGHKQMEAKLHPCLVECNENGIHGEINDMGDVASYISRFVSQEQAEKIEENKQKFEKEEQKKAEQTKMICKLRRSIKEKIDGIKTKIEDVIKKNDTKEENKIIGYDRERIKSIVDSESLDCLDELSYDLLTSKATKFECYKDKDFKPYDFKQYDYPNNKYLDTVQIGENDDLMNYISVKTASRKYKVPGMLIRKLCEKGILDGAVKLKTLGIWMIPKKVKIKINPKNEINIER